MKKTYKFKSAITTLLVLMSASLFLQGCQLFSPKDPTSDFADQPLERRVGEIKSLGGTVSANQGTNLLKMENGENILLKSLQINLDDERYKNHVVEVKGILTTTTDGKQIMEVINIDILEEVATQQTQAVAWKSYSNASLDFNIQFRDDFKLTESDSEVYFQKQIETDPIASLDTQETTAKPIIHQLVITGNKSDSLLMLLGIKDLSDAELAKKSYSRSKIGSAGIDAIKENIGAGQIKYYVQTAKSVYVIELLTGNDNESLNDQNVFYQMLGTFAVGTLSLSEVDSATQTQQSTLQVDADSLKISPIVEPVKAEEVRNVTVPESVNGTQELVDGYLPFRSESLKFSVQYVKNWQYEGLSGAPDYSRIYNFNNKDGSKLVKLSVGAVSIPSGTQVKIGDKVAVKNVVDGKVQLYLKGSGKRVYVFSTTPELESTMLQMAATLQE